MYDHHARHSRAHTHTYTPHTHIITHTTQHILKGPKILVNIHNPVHETTYSCIALLVAMVGWNVEKSAPTVDGSQPQSC